MNALTQSFGSQQDINLRKTSVVGIMERLCQVLEPTDAQYKLVETHHDAVGWWVAAASTPLLAQANLYAHGSFATRTATRPLAGHEYDVDLICHMAALGFVPQPTSLKRALGDRLQANATYARMLEEMPRCWRLNFANEFHLDITPSIPNPQCANGGELVPDKEMKCWKPTNPRGFRALFETRAKLQLRRRLTRAFAADSMSGHVTPFPDQSGFKSPLHRAVQLSKRHRDIYFAEADECLRPISVIITSLLARSYEHCITTIEFDNELDLLCSVISNMLTFISKRYVAGRPVWFIENETTSGENFAEKWNTHPERAQAFFEWHARLQGDVERLSQAVGMDVLQTSLAGSFGTQQVSAVFNQITAGVSAARATNSLFLTPGVGLTAAGSVGSRVRSNTFFGES